MENLLFLLSDLRIEISFNSIDELLSILYFYQTNNLTRLNIPCKKNLNKDFLLDSLKIARREFPNIDIIPHFSINHQFRRNRYNTLKDFIDFLRVAENLACNEVLVISGSQRRVTLDSVSALQYLCEHKHQTFNCNTSIGIAFNPYLPEFQFSQEISRLKLKLSTGLVRSIWFQFGTDYKLLKSRLNLVKNIIFRTYVNNSKINNITLYGSVLIPSKQFLSRFKFRPWKGVYCSDQFLESLAFANDMVSKLLILYKQNQISPIIETKTTKKKDIDALKTFLTT